MLNDVNLSKPFNIMKNQFSRVIPAGSSPSGGVNKKC